MPVTSKPAQGHTNWTTGLNTQVQDPGSKKTTGWIADDIPPFEFENWLQWTLDQWEQYFEYITDLHTTQIAALTTTVGTLGTASAISASTAGHTTLTGANVQLQLDETDAALKDLYDAITAGKGIDLVGYDPVAPGNWSPTPTHAGPALDQLAARMVTVEAASQNVVFTDKNFSDFVVPADDPIDGAGNTGLTSNGTVNPRGLSFSDLATKYGEERIVFMSIERTGNHDAAGRPEWRVITPSNEVRVLFYGQWSDLNHGENGFPTTAFYASVNGPWNKKVLTGGSFAIGDYFLVTGVFDGIGLNTGLNGVTYSQDIEVEIDTVNTGVPLNLTGQAFNNRGNSFMTFSDPSMQNLGHGIHTVKFTQNDATNLEWQVNGVTLIHSNKYQMPGKAWVAKALQSYNSKVTISDPSVGPKGAKVLRYIDRADNVIKDAFNNVTGAQTSVSGTIGSGATTITVVSAVGFAAGDLIEITDGPGNMERLKVQSVGGNNITVPSPGTVNSYTNPTVLMYGKGTTVADHSNERVKARRNARSLANGESSAFNELGNIYGSANWMWFADDGASNAATDGNWAYRTAGGVSGWYHSEFGIYPTANGAKFKYRWVGTGLDVLLDSGTVGGGGTIKVYVDGVDLGVLSNTGNENKWYKVCSDLPEGQHTVIFEISASGTANFSLVDFLEYECAYPSLFNTLRRGNILSMRTIRPSYLFDGNYLYNGASVVNTSDQSRGVIDQSLFRNTRLYSPTQAWAISQNGSLPFGFQVYQGSGAQTGDYIEQYFFGTGFDLEMQYDPTSGINQITIDGNVASAANFPSMVVTGQGYNSANGRVDFYNNPNFTKRISFANVSMTPAWHKVKITITGTKNPSSSDFQIFVQGLSIHNMPFETDMPHEIVGACSELKLGGALDLRVVEADDIGLPPYNWVRSLPTGQDGISPGDPQVPQHLSAKLKTNGYPVEFNFGYSAYTNTAGSSIVIESLIDGRMYSSEYIYQINPAGDPWHYEWKAILNLPAGFHSFRFHLMPSQTLNSYYGGHINVRELVPTQRRRVV